MGKPATEGESPVSERDVSLGQHPSTAEHEEFCGNLGEPPPKAKYFLPPIVNEYREGKAKRTPGGE